MTTGSPPYLKRLLSPLPLDPRREPVPTPAETTPFVTERREIHWPLPGEHLDPEACSVVRRLTAQGFEAYLVGGCVRDLMFGLRPKDFDVVTSATPRDVKRVFRNCRIIGRRFRLAHVFFRDKIIEVATFRSNAPVEAEVEILNDEAEPIVSGSIDSVETKTADGLIIRDDNVFGTAEQDAVRRDFTINALFYDVERETIIDYVGGVHDVERKLLRTIGDPAIRMREDPIRMLRAIRLGSRMGCRLDDASWEAIERFHPEILHAAAPRILEDLLRMFRGGAIAPAFDLMLSSGVIETILPELFAHLRRETNPQGAEEVEALREVLLVADAWTHSGRKISDPVQLALLIAPAVLTKVYDTHGPNTSAAAVALTNDVVRPIAMRLAISKRDSERIRQILLNLTKLGAKGRRRRGAAALARRNYFPDTLELFELLTHATGDGADDVLRWRRRVEEGGGVDEPEEPRRPRRRRGGRRKRP